MADHRKGKRKLSQKLQVFVLSHPCFVGIFLPVPSKKLYQIHCRSYSFWWANRLHTVKGQSNILTMPLKDIQHNTVYSCILLKHTVPCEMNWWCYKHTRHTRLAGYAGNVKQKAKTEDKARLKIQNTTLGLPRHPYLFCCSTRDRLLLPSAVLLQVLPEVDDHNSRAMYLPSSAVHVLLGH